MSRKPKKSIRKAARPDHTGNKPANQQVIHQQEVYSGPIPQPDTLQQYDTIIPGAAERILCMAEENARHRREMESAALTAQVEADKRKHREVTRGQLFGITSVLTAFGLAGLALFLGQATVAGTICGVVVVALATVFITGRKTAE